MVVAQMKHRMGRPNANSNGNPFSEKHKQESLVYKDKKQVELDVARVSISKAAAAKLEKRVGTVLSANPTLNYYQGFHDVSMHSHTTKQLENLALQQLRDFMATDLGPTMQILKLVPELILVCDLEKTGRYFKPVNNSALQANSNRKLSGYFALAPIVTLFSHDCQDSEVIVPIIRNVLKEGLAYVLYLYVALVIENGDALVEKLGPDAEDDEIDMAFQGLASTLTRTNFAKIDQRARRLRSRHKLKALPSWRAVSRFSVLKTGKITKRSTALHILSQLDRRSKISGSMRSISVPSRTIVALAMGAIAVGMLWTRFRR